MKNRFLCTALLCILLAVTLCFSACDQSSGSDKDTTKKKDDSSTTLTDDPTPPSDSTPTDNSEDSSNLPSDSDQPEDSSSHPDDTSNTPDEPSLPPENTMNCTVTVVDAFGNTLAGIKADILQNGTKIQTVFLGEDGTETFSLEKGDYTFTLLPDAEATVKSYFGYSFTYDKDACVLSEDASELTVTLMQKTNGREKLTLDDESTVLASNLTGGAYNVTLSAGLNYFIFRPSMPGIYEISIDKADAEIIHLGSPNYWNDENPLKTSENGILTLEISRMYVSDVEEQSSPYLITVDAKVDTKTDFVLCFQKVAEMPLSPTEVNWISYANPNAEALEKFTIPEGSNVVNVDVFDADLQIVFNETDGYYHVGDENGPVVLIRLTTESTYLASFFTICNTDLLRSFFYDEDGNFQYKEQYNDLIHQYTGEPDINGSLVQGAGVYDPSTGTYPMDQYLAHFMKNAGETMGWWNPESYNYRFEEQNLLGLTLTENAWLFACCYVAE
ncbi:MAG: hypothetical protein IJW49_00320 [Clostridia bacterium]|nr:hypothetical protein [Clostridia bacterium]